MTHIVAIDSGTTSTKAFVVVDGEIIGQARAFAGARDVAGGRAREWLAERIRYVAEEALASARIGWPNVDAMIGFGMLTSELGLEEVPHLRAPVGIEQLALGMRPSSLTDDISVPLFLVPGVICEGLPDVGRDFMRGEETQVIGLLASGRAKPPLLYVSPGSHTKFVAIDTDGRIEWSFTTLSGELVWALSAETILGPILDPSQPISDVEAADRGARVARQVGLSRALYAARLSNRLEGASVESCTDFVRGAIAAVDVDGLGSLSHLPSTVLVGTGSQLGIFYQRLLATETWAVSVEAVDEPLGPLGAWQLYVERLAFTRNQT